ncbi:L,D-transpeptidase [Hoeflea sp.]|uniref:L,D-transpeptidase n=1 Tax=Hoeflea sp. TaxID=1940281 RepID=UPI003B018886
MTPKTKTSRRQFLAGSASLCGVALAGCTTTDQPDGKVVLPRASSNYALMYGPVRNERFPIPAVDISRVPKQYYRRLVAYDGPEAPGTVVVDTRTFFLYLVEGGGRATRYGVGLGRAGFEWSGRARIAWKQAWPKWTPPDSMIAREPELERWSVRNGGMPPGLNNPLGARALYIFQGNVDTLYRVHGTPEYWTIGKAVSSGCVRMMNQDVIHLYGRVPTDAKILVI